MLNARLSRRSASNAYDQAGSRNDAVIGVQHGCASHAAPGRALCAALERRQMPIQRGRAQGLVHGKDVGPPGSFQHAIIERDIIDFSLNGGYAGLMNA